MSHNPTLQVVRTGRPDQSCGHWGRQRDWLDWPKCWIMILMQTSGPRWARWPRPATGTAWALFQRRLPTTVSDDLRLYCWLLIMILFNSVYFKIYAIHIHLIGNKCFVVDILQWAKYNKRRFHFLHISFFWRTINLGSEAKPCPGRIWCWSSCTRPSAAPEWRGWG